MIPFKLLAKLHPFTNFQYGRCHITLPSWFKYDVNSLIIVQSVVSFVF